MGYGINNMYLTLLNAHPVPNASGQNVYKVYKYMLCQWRLLAYDQHLIALEYILGHLEVGWCWPLSYSP